MLGIGNSPLNGQPFGIGHGCAGTQLGSVVGGRSGNAIVVMMGGP